MKLKSVAILAAILCLALPNLGFAQCGDFNNDALVNVADMTDYVDFLWNGGPAPVNYANADIDDHRVVTMSDLVTLIRYLNLGAAAPTCPPTQPKYKSIKNANVNLTLDNKHYTSYPGTETIQILLETGTKQFVYLDLPIKIYVGKASPHLAQVVSVTIDPVFTSWSNGGPNYKIDASGSLLLSFVNYLGTPLGPYGHGNRQLVATVEISVPQNPGGDDRIYMKYDYNFPPVVAPYGSSHYPLMICSGWPKNDVESYEPALEGPPIPSLTTWGFIVLVILLMVSSLWLVVKRKNSVA